MSVYVAYHPIYVHAVPPGHRFPMEKYQLIYEQLHYEGLSDHIEFIIPEPIAQNDVLAVHDEVYVKRLVQLELSDREQRVSGFKHSEALIERELRIMEGTRRCAQAVIDGGIALNIAGGTHHAFTNRGEGFCLLNDQAIAAAWLLNNTQFKRILIIDLDVHQGNGTAEIFKDENRVFTFSMHGAGNYPLQKERSDKDIGLDPNTNDEIYLKELEIHLCEIVTDFNPDFLFYQCGVDILETDKLGLLQVSQNGIRARDELVLTTAKKNNLPLVCTMGGGYSKHIRDIVNAHMHVFRLATQLFEKK